MQHSNRSEGSAMEALLPSGRNTESSTEDGNLSAEALRASLLADHDPEEFARILAILIDKIVVCLHMRVGLVPNYFMTRGEASEETTVFSSFNALGRKTAEKIFKLFHQKDFREEQLCNEFNQIMQIIREAVVINNQVNTRSSFTDAIAEVLNRQIYNNRAGDTLLQILIKRRHLRLVRILLLHASELLDPNQRNRRGYSALDLAYDRLEVEMFYLLVLHGATTPSASRTNHKSSLGYCEWFGYDMTLNLDTGRWLHKQSEQAIMDYAQTSLSLSVREALLQWAKGEESVIMRDDTLGELGRIPRLFAIVLADGCDAITNHEAWATIIRHLALLRESSIVVPLNRESTENIVSDDVNTITPVEATPCSNLCDFLKDHNVVDTSNFHAAGRTLFFHCTDGKKKIAVKFSKSLEDCKTPHPLAKESAMNTMIANFKKTHGLQSDYPVTVELLRLSNVPQEMRLAIEGQQARGYHPFEISSDEEGVAALVYRPPQDYTRYANEYSLSLDACRRGIEEASYDSAVLARHGLYHGALVDIQHDSSREQRPHLWSFESFLTRFRGGAGRIEKGFLGLGAPNVRASGLGDLKHIVNEAQVKSRYDPSVIHAQHNILYDDEERLQVALIEQLGASLFATTLLVGSSWQSRHERGVPESENLDLSQELKNCFSTFLRGYLQIDASKAGRFLSLVGADFDIMAAQIKMFSTPEYARIAETAPRRPIFGFLAKVLGWLTHPTAFVHFAQRGSLELTGWRSLSEIQQVYTSQISTADLPDGYPRIDTSMMRCSPTWVRGRGWVNKEGQAHLGSYEGVLPFQQLIHDLYAVVLLAWLMRHNDGSFQMLS